RQVASTISVTEVGEQARPLADHLQQAAAAGVVLLVRPHVLVELVDASGEQRDLHFRGARVSRLASKLIDDLRFSVLRNRHHAPRQPPLGAPPASTYETSLPLYPGNPTKAARDCKGDVAKMAPRSCQRVLARRSLEKLA